MPIFNRSITDLPKFKAELSREPLFPLLLADIKSGEVFPAIRNDYICFYFKGSRLFTFDLINRFQTHIKYAAVIHSKKTYINQADLAGGKLFASNFSDPDTYQRMKENASLHAGIEALGVAELYAKNSIASLTSMKCEYDGYVVLNIEIAFTNQQSSSEEIQDEDVPENVFGGKKRKKIDRLDILLLNTKNGKLRFVEAKHFTNPELWSKIGTPPKVIDQVKRYVNQVTEPAKTPQILAAYEKHLYCLDEPFGTSCKCTIPLSLDDTTPVSLWLFGFDANQRDGRLKELLKDDKSLIDIYYYPIGNVKEVDACKLWQNTKKGN